MPLKPHPTDPDKMVYTRAEYNLPREWVGLTAYEIASIPLDEHALQTVEKLLKEKNT
jgi:hypothetical protein